MKKMCYSAGLYLTIIGVLPVVFATFNQSEVENKTLTAVTGDNFNISCRLCNDSDSWWSYVPYINSTKFHAFTRSNPTGNISKQGITFLHGTSDGDILSISPVSSEHAGNYTCQNDFLRICAVLLIVTTSEKIHNSKSGSESTLSRPIIIICAGLAVLIVLSIIIILIYYYHRRKAKLSAKSHKLSLSPQDLHIYTDIENTDKDDVIRMKAKPNSYHDHSYGQYEQIDPKYDTKKNDFSEKEEVIYNEIVLEPVSNNNDDDDNGDDIVLVDNSLYCGHNLVTPDINTRPVLLNTQTHPHTADNGRPTVPVSPEPVYAEPCVVQI